MSAAERRSSRGARTKARKRALDVLFESELRGLRPGETLAERQEAANPPVNPYTAELVRGVVDHLTEIDAAITDAAAGWTLDRMPAVDRNLLRIATFEIRYAEAVPAAVAINEAVELAKDLSTDESPAFLNGVLSTIAAVTDATQGDQTPTAPTDGPTLAP